LGADLVVLSAPISAMDQVAALAAPHLDGVQILADVCSVKVNPVRRMLAEYAGPVVGTHPLFGGALPAPEDRRVAVTPARDQDAADAVCAWFRELGFIPFTSTPQAHDRALSYIQGLNFVSTVAYLATMAHDHETEKFLTPSFRRRLEAAKKMLTRDAKLFESIFEMNPESQDMVRRFRSHLNVAAGGDVDLLVQRAAWWWRNGYSQGT
jgi:prephenate dehydrogenase